MNSIRNPKRTIQAVTRWLVVLTLIAVMGLMAILIDSQASEVMSAPQLLAGDRWERSNGRIYEVIGEEGGHYLVRRFRQGQITEELWDKGTLSIVRWREPGKELKVSTKPPQQLLLFPLSIGKKWDFSYWREYENALVARWNKVEGWQEVGVPAGSFRALRIRSDGRRIDTGYQFTEIYWYSPEVRGLVKGTSDAKNPAGREPMEFELLKFTPGRSKVLETN